MDLSKSATVQLYAVDVTAPIVPDGPIGPDRRDRPGAKCPLRFTGTAGQHMSAFVSVPGQNARLTVAGVQGQQVTVRLTGNTFGNTWVRLLRPNGSTQKEVFTAWASFTLATQTLESTGPYTVLVDPSLGNTGSIAVQVTSP